MSYHDQVTHPPLCCLIWLLLHLYFCHIETRPTSSGPPCLAYFLIPTV
jgi:hypothetical protein